MARARRALSELFAVDLRSLALLRIGLGVSVLADVLQRARDLVALYTDAGVLPRDLLVAMEGRAVAFSVHYWASAAPVLEAAVFVLTATCAVALVVGWHTRVMAVLCWYLVSSVQVRQPLVYYGGDSVLRLTLFWACLLPLGARFSADRAQGRVAPMFDRFVSGATVALLLQVCLIYWATALRKTGPLWWSGQAIFYALHREAWVTGFGVWLRGHPAVLEVLTYATLALEFLGPCLAFVPFWTPIFRLATVAMFWSFHVGLAAAMSIGLFPVVSMVAWLPFLPRLFWTGLGVRDVEVAPTSRHGWDRVVSVAAGVLLAYVVVLLAQRAHVIPTVVPARLENIGKALRIQQVWNMFAPDPPRTSTTYELRRVDADGGVTFESATTSFRSTIYLMATHVNRDADDPLSRSRRRFVLQRCAQGSGTARLQLLAHQRETRPEGAGDPITRTLEDVACPTP